MREKEKPNGLRSVFYAPSIFNLPFNKAFGSTNTASASPADWLCAKYANLKQNFQLIEITREFLNSGARLTAHRTDDSPYRLIKIYALQTKRAPRSVMHSLLITPSR